MAKKSTGKTARRKTSSKAATRTSASRSASTRKSATRKVAKKTTGKSVREPAGASAGSRKAGATSRKPGVETTPKAVSKPVPRLAETAATAPHLAATAAQQNGPVRKYLKPKDLAQFRELLLEKRAQLVGDVSTLQAEALSKNRQDAAGDLSSMPIHMADLGTDNYEKEFTLGLIEGERALLRDIDDALVRIDKGTYGVCEATGKPIGKARLRARPWAKFCYEYVLAQEKGRQSSGS